MGYLSLALTAPAATRTTANYAIITDSLASGGAAFSPSYANRAALEPVVGLSGATIPDSSARFIYHGFIPQLDAPLFAVADVAVSLTATPILSSPGEVVTFSGAVSNPGAELAPGVVLTLTLPANVNYTGATLSQGTATLAGNLLQCHLGTIAANEVVTFAIQVTPSSNGSALVNAAVTLEAVDPELGNNAASAQSTVVTTVTWTGAGNGSWQSPANWSPAIVPGADHRVVFTAGAADLNGSVTVSALNLTGGRIIGPHRLTVATLANWTGGEVQNGATLVMAPGSLLRVTGGVQNLRGVSLENRGTTRLESTALQSVSAAWITNYGLFEIVGEPSFQRYQDVGGFIFHNHAGATFRKSAGVGTSSLALTTFQNDGLAEVLTGTMEFAGIMINNATNRAAAGTQMRYTKANYFNHGCAIEGPGLQRIVQATSLANDATTFGGAMRGDFEIAQGIMYGTLTNTGSITWSGGSFQGSGAQSGANLVIPPGSLLRVTGGAQYLSGASLENRGTTRLESAALQSVSAAWITNYGLFEIVGEPSFQRFQGVGGFIFHNHAGATLRKSAGVGTSALDLTLFRNDGLLDLRSGTLALTSGYAPGATASLNIYVGGTTPGTQFSRLTVSGAATLNGALKVILNQGFVPGALDTFQVLTASSRAGTFSDFSVVPAGLALAPSYLANGVTVRLVPGAATINAASARHVGGQFQFTFEGSAGATFVVEASPTVGPGATWVPIQTNVSSGIPILLLDPAAQSFPTRSYRVKLAP